MVKRYDIADDDDSGDVSMMEFEDGEYVTFAEYDALAARLAEAERLVAKLPCKCRYLGDGDVIQCDRCALLRPTVSAADATVDENRRFREALNIIASWDEGAEVTSRFDEPGSAKLAREVLAKGAP